MQKDDIESQGTLGTLPAMTFTPDSKYVIASYGGKIYRIPIDGGGAVNIPFLIDEEIELAQSPHLLKKEYLQLLHRQLEFYKFFHRKMLLHICYLV